MAGMGLGIGLKALIASQAGLEVTGHNVANASTPGYSRQSLALSSSAPLRIGGRWMGTGVDPGVVSRTVDSLLAQRIVSQTSSLSRLNARAVGYSQLEGLLSEPGDLGLSARFGKFFSSMSELSVSASDGVLRAGFVQQASGLAQHFQELAGGLERLRGDSLGQVPPDLAQVNGLAREISHLNQRIGEVESSGSPANDMRDQREMRLGELAKLVDISYQEQPNGSLLVSVGGRLLVGSTNSFAMEAKSKPSGGMELSIEGSSVPVGVLRGGVAARLEMGNQVVPGVLEGLDKLARNLILEFNRAHSTGVPAKGHFQQLVGANALKDTNGNGDLHDELLSAAGLPFDVQAGELQVNVTDVASGELTTHRLTIDPQTTTVGGFLAALSGIPGISAALDGKGHLKVVADSGKGFDFAARLDASPDDLGTFGGGHASLATPFGGPFNLADGDTLELQGPSGPISIAFAAADFANIGEASAAELAAVLNADASFGANGLRAVTVDGRLVVQTNDVGAQASFDVTGGSALAALGFVPATIQGSDFPVGVAISGEYTGSSNDRYTFVPTSSGTIGSTPGLSVEVRDSSGGLVTVLNVGEGYQPGQELDVGNGVRVSFGLGEVSTTGNDLFVLDVTADADSADVLVALGLNSLFVGTGASDIALRADLEGDPGGLSASASGVSGDNGVLLRMLGLQNGGVAGLGGESVTGFYGGLVSEVGFNASSANNALEVEQFLMDGLLQRRDQISGVSMDEELVNMMQFEQTYQAAARYIQVVSKLGEELLALL